LQLFPFASQERKTAVSSTQARPALSSRTVGASSPLARIALAGFVSFFAASVVVGALNPGYSPIREAMSALAATNARYAGLMIAAFLLAAVAFVSTGILLWRQFAGSRAGRVAAGLIMVGGPEMAVCGLARQDCSERLPSCIDYGSAPLASTHFWVHQYVALVLFTGLTVAMFLLARAVRTSAGREYLARPTRLIAIYCVLTIVVVFMAEIGNSYHGLFQRLFAVLTFGWPLLIATTSPRPAPAGADARNGVGAESSSLAAR
jgi:hypothetical membrane protein